MKLYRIFLPKKYNNNEPVPAEKIKEITEQIVQKFGGYSMTPSSRLPFIQGVWVSDIGERYHDDMFLIEVFAEDTHENKRWVQKMKEVWKALLEQKELFILEQNAELV